MRKLKNEPDYADSADNAIVKALISQSQNGTLYGRDVKIAEEINETIWGEDSVCLREYQTGDINKALEASKDTLFIHVHPSLSAKTSSLLLNLSVHRAVVVCGPSLSGKSTMIKVLLNYFLQ